MRVCVCVARQGGAYIAFTTQQWHGRGRRLGGGGGAWFLLRVPPRLERTDERASVSRQEIGGVGVWGWVVSLSPRRERNGHHIIRIISARTGE